MSSGADKFADHIKEEAAKKGGGKSQETGKKKKKKKNKGGAQVAPEDKLEPVASFGAKGRKVSDTA